MRIWPILGFSDQMLLEIPAASQFNLAQIIETGTVSSGFYPGEFHLSPCSEDFFEDIDLGYTSAPTYFKREFLNTSYF